MQLTVGVQTYFGSVLKRVLRAKDLVAVTASLHHIVQYPILEAPESLGAARIMVFAPHPDDEVLGCGGTIMRYRTSGASVKVVYMTDGRCGNPRFDPEVLAREREKEALEGLEVLGCTDAKFLRYPDCGLRSNMESIGNVSEQITSYRPDAIFIPFPLDEHPDHICTAAIVGEALQEYSDDVTCYCYEVWSTLLPNTIVDISGVAAKKEEAIRKHRTQTEVIDYTDKVIGLNAYRSLTAGIGTSHCEAFFKCTRGELSHLLKRIGW